MPQKRAMNEARMHAMLEAQKDSVQEADSNYRHHPVWTPNQQDACFRGFKDYLKAILISRGFAIHTVAKSLRIQLKDMLEWYNSDSCRYPWITQMVYNWMQTHQAVVIPFEKRVHIALLEDKVKRLEARIAALVSQPPLLMEAAAAYHHQQQQQQQHAAYLLQPQQQHAAATVGGNNDCYPLHTRFGSQDSAFKPCVQQLQFSCQQQHEDEQLQHLLEEGQQEKIQGQWTQMDPSNACHTEPPAVQLLSSRAFQNLVAHVVCGSQPIQLPYQEDCYMEGPPPVYNEEQLHASMIYAPPPPP